MKAKIFSIAVLLFLVSAFTTGNAQSCSSAGEGTAFGSLTCSLSPADGTTVGEYDPYILGGLTLNYWFYVNNAGAMHGSGIAVSGYGLSGTYYSSTSGQVTTTGEGYWALAFNIAGDGSSVSASLTW